MATCRTNCTLWRHSLNDANITSPTIKADPDIAGIGIISTFVISAFIVLSLSAAHIFLTPPYLPEANPIDVWVFKFLQNLLHVRVVDEKREFWVPVIENVVLSLSDQQLLTGLAVLIASMWTHCSISVHHFTLASDLAWFSANVHITTLGILTDKLRRMHLLRNWRVSLMICLALFLALSSVMQGHWAWWYSQGYNAQCLLEDLIGNVSGTPSYWMSLNLIFIGITYPASIVMLYETPAKIVFKWLLKKPKAFFENRVHRLKGARSGSVKPLSLRAGVERLFIWIQLLTIYMFRLIHLTLAALIISKITDLAYCMVWFALGLWNVIIQRNSVSVKIDGAENEMSFGQIIPILLLSSTVFVFREAYDDQMTRHVQEVLPQEAGLQTSFIHDARPTQPNPSSQGTYERRSESHDGNDEIELLPGSPRRVDTETGDRTQASGHDNGFWRQEPQRRPTLPPSRSSA